MIDIEFQPLPDEQVKAIQKWLNEPAATLARTAILHKAFQAEIEAVKALVEAVTDPAREQDAKDSAREAANGLESIRLLEAMREGYYGEDTTRTFEFVTPVLSNL